MNGKTLVEALDDMRLGVIEVSSLPTDLLSFLEQLSNLPVPWTIRYFDDGNELLDAMTDLGRNVQQLVAVLPSDLGIAFEKLSVRAITSQAKVLLVLGKAYRAGEDRIARWYLRR